MAKVGENQARFEKFIEVDSETGCYYWTGSKNRQGYGRFSVQYRGKEKKMYAHRMAYQGYVGWIPEGLFVCHRCDNPSCVNVEHLFLGTNEDNLGDMASKGRSMRGEKQHLSKLTEEQVLEARKIRQEQNLKIREIADRYGVELSTMYDALVGNTWKHI